MNIFHRVRHFFIEEDNTIIYRVLYFSFIATTVLLPIQLHELALGLFYPYIGSREALATQMLNFYICSIIFWLIGHVLVKCLNNFISDINSSKKYIQGFLRFWDIYMVLVPFIFISLDSIVYRHVLMN